MKRNRPDDPGLTDQQSRLAGGHRPSSFPGLMAKNGSKMVSLRQMGHLPGGVTPGDCIVVQACYSFLAAAHMDIVIPGKG